MPSPKNISIKDFTYELPEDRIALRPLEQRDQSKLLVWKEEKIQEDKFCNIAAYIRKRSLMVFNNSKVINARIRMEKSTGSVIEIFCLEPHGVINDYSVVMNQKGTSKWKCFIGGASKWKEEYLIKEFNHHGQQVQLRASISEKQTDAYVVAFDWMPTTFSFAEVLMAVGDIPLPPYIKRKTGVEDADRYQTIYAKEEGSVAAPTAGLHFSEHIFQSFADNNIQKTEVSLHVGAGTFKPVKAATMKGHEMHAEWIDVSTETINNLINQKDDIIAIGTTSLRTIESIYWLGVKTILHPEIEQLTIGQWDVYDLVEEAVQIDRSTALTSLLKWMLSNQKEHIFTQTQLLITPGYKFRVANALVTNFHQPESTLLLLVAAAIGQNWKKCYEYAIDNDFRFLSYGDGSLIFIAENQG